MCSPLAVGHYRLGVTDIPNVISSIPARLGTSLTLDNGQLVGHLSSPRAIASRGAASMAAVAFLIDVVGGMTIDTDPNCWAFTSDLSIRLPRAIAPISIETRALILRNGGRSAVCEMPLVVDGVEWGSSLISFAKVSRRDGDPVKPPFDAHSAVTRMPSVPLDETLRSAAGFISRDRSRGEVAAELQTELLNPAGAMQGAVVAGLIEAAAEDLADELLGGDHPHVVIEMEVRFLAQNRIAPIVSSARFVGPPSEGCIRVDLFDDDGNGRRTTSGVVRVAPSPS